MVDETIQYSKIYDPQTILFHYFLFNQSTSKNWFIIALQFIISPFNVLSFLCITKEHWIGFFNVCFDWFLPFPSPCLILITFSIILNQGKILFSYFLYAREREREYVKKELSSTTMNCILYDIIQLAKNIQNLNMINPHNTPTLFNTSNAPTIAHMPIHHIYQIWNDF